MGSNYEYWSERHDNMIEKGWSQINFRDLDQCEELFTRSESAAKGKVIKLRETGNYARIICVANRLRIKTYAVLFKPKDKR